MVGFKHIGSAPGKASAIAAALQGTVSEQHARRLSLIPTQNMAA
jgi:DNA-binding transcriptional regulator YdaS (Cro superfamily)